MSRVSTPRPPRVLTPDEKALKTTVGALIQECGGVGAVASVLEIAPSLISAYASQSFPDRMMPIDRILKLEGLLGRPIVSRWMVDHQARADSAPGDLGIADVLRISRKSSETKIALLDALEDGVVTSAERAVIRTHCDEEIAMWAEIRTKVEQP